MATSPNVLKAIFSRNAIGFIMLAYAILFVLVKNPHDPYDRLIINDGKAYYAYLPALFIYQDLEFGFVEYYESKYYPSDADPTYFKEFRFKYRGQTVNKTFSGITVLMLPFFLLAHAMALLFGTADGYSIIYQYAIGFSAYFYLWLSLLTLRKLLRNFSENENLLALILFSIALGTNLVYYTVVEGTMPHVYLFFLVNLFLLLTYRAIHEKQAVFHLGAAAVFGLILITRPQNGFIILILPFLAGNHRNFVSWLSGFLKNARLLLKTITFFLAVISLQIALWFAQTGYLLAYSYGEETFNFLNPHIFNILWSYEKGWMVYTPMAFIAITGIIHLFRKSVYQAVFMVLTFVVLTYVMSSWWVWHYTSQFGQRVFIDFYGLLAILLIAGFSLLKARYYKLLYQALIVLFILLNLFQFYQHMVWVYPRGPVTAQSFWNNFFNIRPQSGVVIPEAFIAGQKSFEFPFDYYPGGPKDQQHHRLHKLEPYKLSPLFSLVYGKDNSPGRTILRVRTGIYSCPESALNLQFDFYSGGRKYSEHIAMVNRYLRCGRMNEIEAAVYLPVSFDDKDSVQVSLMSPEFLEVSSGNSTAALIFLEPETELRWISKPLNAVTAAKNFYCIMEDCDRVFNLQQVSQDIALKGNYSSRIAMDRHFGAGISVRSNDVFDGLNRAVNVNAMLYSEAVSSSGRLVFSVHSDENVVYYKSFPIALQEKGWQEFKVVNDFPRFADDYEIRIYFWDPNAVKPWYIDDLVISFLTLTDRHIPLKSHLVQTLNESIPQISLADMVRVDSYHPFYGPPEIMLQEISDCTGIEVFVTAKVMADCWFPEASIVMAHLDMDKQLVQYQSQRISSSVLKDHWQQVYTNFNVPACVSENDILRLYVWNSSAVDKLKVTDFTVSINPN